MKLPKPRPQMDIDQVVVALKQILPPGRLSPIEEFILRQSWQGQTYGEMAKDSGYGSDYIKEIGSQLWQDLSTAMGQHITKKNLHLRLNQLQPTQSLRPVNQPQQEFQPHVTDGYQVAEVAAKTKIDFPGTPLPFGSPLYIARPPIEEIANSELSKPGCIVRIRASGKMGKNSLLNQLMAHTKRQQYRTIYLDFQEADATIFASLDRFLRWFCANISRQLNLSPRLDDFWDDEMGSKMSCKIYFEAYLLEQVSSPLVLILNEVKRVFEHLAIAKEFLPMLRSWHEQAQQDDSPWQTLRLVLAHSTEIYVPLKLNQSPFNVGLAITLPLFTLKQTQELARRFELEWAAGEAGAQRLAPLLKMVGGHPYLISLAFYHLSQSSMPLDDLLRSAPTQAGIYSQHLQNHLTLLQAEPQLVSALRQVFMTDGNVQLNAVDAHKLEGMGLIQLDGNQAKPSCELYRLYFREQLGAANWLDTNLEQLPQGQQAQYPFNNTNEPTHLPNQSYFNRYLLSNLDQSTHLANQSYFNRYLAATWHQLSVEATSMSLILCEIDYLKSEDVDGSSNRDICLQLIGSTILDCVGKQIACVAHFDDKEFAMILPRADTEIAVAIADNIRESIKSLLIEPDNPKADGFSAQIATVSLGVASTTPSSETSVTTLVAAAEAALDRAKKQGGDCICISSASSLET